MTDKKIMPDHSHLSYTRIDRPTDTPWPDRPRSATPHKPADKASDHKSKPGSDGDKKAGHHSDKE